MNPWTTETFCGGIPMPDWYMERLSTFEISATPRITEYWHSNDPECETSGRVWVKYFLKSPSVGKSMDYRDVLWWYSYAQLVYGEVEHFWNQENSYNHRVLALEWSRLWDICWSLSKILSKISISRWTHGLLRPCVVVFLCPIGCLLYTSPSPRD